MVCDKLEFELDIQIIVISLQAATELFYIIFYCIYLSAVLRHWIYQHHHLHLLHSELLDLFLCPPLHRLGWFVCILHVFDASSYVSIKCTCSYYFSLNKQMCLMANVFTSLKPPIKALQRSKLPDKKCHWSPCAHKWSCTCMHVESLHAQQKEWMKTRSLKSFLFFISAALKTDSNFLRKTRPHRWVWSARLLYTKNTRWSQVSEQVHFRTKPHFKNFYFCQKAIFICSYFSYPPRYDSPSEKQSRIGERRKIRINVWGGKKPHKVHGAAWCDWFH